MVQNGRFWTVGSESLRVFCKRDLGTCYVFKTGILHQICGSPSGFSFWGGDLWWDTGEEARGEKTSRYELKKKKTRAWDETRRDDQVWDVLPVHPLRVWPGRVHTHLSSFKVSRSGSSFQNGDKMNKMSKITWTIWKQKEQNINIMGAISMGIPKTLEIIQIQ